MTPTTKYGIGIIAGLVVVGFVIFGVLLSREVANLTVIADLEVGECVGEHFQPANDAAEGEFFEILFISRADCGQAHAYEVYAATVMWDANEAFPDVDAAFWEGEDYCHEQFSFFLGEGYQSSPYEFFTFVPTIELWDNGHREVQCLIGHSDGTTLVTDSLRGRSSQVAS